MRKKLLIATIITISLVANLVLAQKLYDYNKLQSEIDQEFSIELARVAGFLKEGDTYLALEHAHKVSSLSNYTSYSKENEFVNGYSRNIVTDLRNASHFNKEISNLGEVVKLLNSLSENPTNTNIASKLLSEIHKQED
ncbi:hypothetical protein [Bacillus solitudinis]|uniref:hypothetical protein n=1 Tax=Bacillus solitudinis TaxID=2014074 RepID=UPI000C231A72|nr:hypothetical protein [Bacillus solitudinis]